jgi:hypothetical protein
MLSPTAIDQDFLRRDREAQFEINPTQLEECEEDLKHHLWSGVGKPNDTSQGGERERGVGKGVTEERDTGCQREESTCDWGRLAAVMQLEGKALTMRRYTYITSDL